MKQYFNFVEAEATKCCRFLLTIRNVIIYMNFCSIFDSLQFQ